LLSPDRCGISPETGQTHGLHEHRDINWNRDGNITKPTKREVRRMSYPVAGYGYGGGYSKSVAFVLVLFILLVIILKSGILY